MWHSRSTARKSSICIHAISLHCGLIDGTLALEKANFARQKAGQVETRAEASSVQQSNSKGIMVSKADSVKPDLLSETEALAHAKRSIISGRALPHPQATIPEEQQSMPTTFHNQH